MKHLLKGFGGAALAVTLLGPAAVDAQQVTVGVNTTSNCYPFICMAGDGGTRYQQVYSSSAFTSGSININSLTFYMSSGAANADGNNYAISLSTTSAGVNALSTNASSNVGGNNALFFSGILSGAINPSFTISGNPFLYDPTAGNLLMDILISGSNTQGYVAFMDADDRGTVTSRTWDFNSQTTADQVGLVTTFDYTPAVVATPEPASLALFATGLIGVAAIRRRKRA